MVNPGLLTFVSCCLMDLTEGVYPKDSWTLMPRNSNYDKPVYLGGYILQCFPWSVRSQVNEQGKLFSASNQLL